MTLQAPPKATQITFQTFEEWTDTCGVKKAQREYEKMALDGKANGRSAVEEMHARGFKDFNSFQKACKRFPLTCWPSDLAELGSGFVLYFQFLAALAIMLLAILILQLPAMSAYGQEDYRCGWVGQEGAAWRRSYRIGSALERADCPPGADDGAGRKGFLTPGNFGPDQATSALIPTLYTACVFVICATVFYAYQVFVVTDRLVDAATVSPSDFAVTVSGLPALATDEKVIAKFFRENGLTGKSDAEVVKVVIGWDAEEFREKIEQIRGLKSQIDCLEPSDPEIRSLVQQIKEISGDLSSSAPDRASRLKSSGVVVVVFRYQSDQAACLQKWNGFWARWAYCEAKDLCCFSAALPGAALPRFPVGDPPLPVHRLRVTQAAEPGDIVWEHLGVPQSVRAKRFALTWSAMILVLLVSFAVAYGLVIGKSKSGEMSSKGAGGEKHLWQAVSILPSLLIVINNIAITIFAKWLGGKEFHNTHTDKDFSQALKMTWGMIANTAGVLFFVKAQPREWYLGNGLVPDVFTMLLVNAVAPPLLNLVDFGYKMKGTMRPWGCSKRKLTREKLAKLNETVTRLAPLSKKTKEDEQALELVKKTVEFYKRAYTPSQMSPPRAYANALKTFVCCVVYSPLLPLVSLFGLIGILLQLTIDKYLLLRWYQRPTRPSNCRMAMFSLLFVKYVAPGSLAVAFWVFLTPSWERKEAVYTNFIISVIGAAAFALLVPLAVWAKGCLRCTGALKERVEQDYYQAQYMWSKEMKYHKDQFLYKKLPEAKNPEHLQPGRDSAVGADDLKASYGAGAQGVADAAGSAAAVRLRGGLATRSDTRPDLPTLGAWAASASTPGSSAPAQAAAAAAAVAPAGPTLGTTQAPPQGYIPGALADAARRTHPHGIDDGDGSPVWEYVVKDGWDPFADDCQQLIESRYQHFRKGQGPVQVEVKTRGFEVSVDFGKMTTKKVGVPKIRQVRRRCE